MGTSLGQKFKAYRLNSIYPPYMFAKQLGISPKYLNYIEDDLKRPNLTIVNRLSVLLSLSSVEKQELLNLLYDSTLPVNINIIAIGRKEVNVYNKLAELINSRQITTIEVETFINLSTKSY